MDEDLPELIRSAVSSWQGPYYGPSDDQMKYIMLLALGGTALLIFALLQYLGHRRRMTEMRYKTLETLAKTGNLQPRQIEEYLSPAKTKAKAVMVFAWFGLITGILILIGGAVAGGRDGDEIMLGGFIVAAASSAIFATPIMLRELRKQGLI